MLPRCSTGKIIVILAASSQNVGQVPRWHKINGHKGVTKLVTPLEEVAISVSQFLKSGE